MSAGLPASAVQPRSAVVSTLDQAMEDVVQQQAGVAQEVVAVELHTAFLCTTDGPLAATARVTGGGRSVSFCEAEARNARGQLVATAMGTYRIRPKAPTGEPPCT